MTKAQFLAEYERLKRSAGRLYTPKSAAAVEAELKRAQAAKVATDNARLRAMESQVRRRLPAGQIKQIGQPRIDRVVAVDPVSPGERFYILGQFLGGASGKAELVFATPPKRVQLTVHYWNPDGIALDVAVPNSLSGYGPQAVSVQLTRADGATSNEVRTTYIGATRRVPFDFHFSAETCRPSQDAAELGIDDTNSNYCKETAGGGPVATHHLAACDMGVDTIPLPPLINGFTYCYVSTTTFCLPQDFCTVAVAGFVEGSRGPLTLHLPWQFVSNSPGYPGGLQYGPEVHVCGPEGMPYLNRMSQN